MLPRGTVGHTHRSRVGGRGGGPAVAARSRLSSRAWSPATGDDLAGRASRPSRPSTTTAWAYRARLPLRLTTTSRIALRHDRHAASLGPTRPASASTMLDERGGHAAVEPLSTEPGACQRGPFVPVRFPIPGSGPHCRRTCTWGPGPHGSARGHDHGDASGRPRNSPLASDEQAVRFDCALPGFTPHVVVWNPARKVD